MRNKGRKNEKKDDTIPVTENAFPSLGSTTVPQARWNGNTSFSKLASDWKEKDDKEKEKAESERFVEIVNRASMPVSMTNLYRLRRQQSEENTYDDAPVAEKTTTEDTEWTKIEKKPKHRVVKTLEQRMIDEENERIRKEQEENMWTDDGPEMHDTYWDQKY